jgi:hypothetical protein
MMTEHKPNNLKTLIAKLGGWSEEGHQFTGWRGVIPDDDLSSMIFVNDEVNPQYDDNEHRCVCYQTLKNTFQIVNRDETKYAIVRCHCIQMFPDELRQEYKDWLDIRKGVKKCSICDKKMRTNHDGVAHNKRRAAQKKKDDREAARIVAAEFSRHIMDKEIHEEKMRIWRDERTDCAMMNDFIEPSMDTLLFGKHKGKTWSYVKKSDPSYIEFVFSDKFKAYGRSKTCIRQLKQLPDSSW